MKKLLLCVVVLAMMGFAFTACAGNGNGDDAPPAQDGAAPVATPTPAPAATPAPGADAPPTIAPEIPVFEPFPTGHPLAGMNSVLERFPQFIETGLPHVEGTTFRFALTSASPWAGLFGMSAHGDATDDATISTIIGTEASLFSMSSTLTWGQDGIVNYTYDIANNTITLNMQHDVLWHDGVPMTLDDLVFVFEVMATPGYTGIRFGNNEQSIVGIMDFHYGYSDTIEGLVLSNNNRTLTIHLEVMPPEILYFGLWSSPAPRHVFGHMNVEDIPNSDEFRLQPIGWGPFQVISIVPGETVHLRRFDDYVWGTPYIEYMMIERVHPDLVPARMAAGEFDSAAFSAIQFADHQYPTNFRYITSVAGNYDFVAFRFGYFDWDEGVMVPEPERLMWNPYLRRAMSRAVNYQLLGEVLFNGLRFPAGSPMSPLHYGFMDLTVPAFSYDPELARQILDAGGFIDIDGDGFREMPDGSQLTINWGFITGEDDDTIIGFKTQAWADIGLRVELWQGRAHDRLALWDILDFDEDNQEVHIYNWGWTAGANPNPTGRWGPNAWWSPNRYSSDELTAILERIPTAAAWDMNYLLSIYSAYQRYIYDNIPFFPTFWRVELSALNNRVANWDTRIGIPPALSGWHTTRLTAAEPYVG